MSCNAVAAAGAVYRRVYGLARHALPALLCLALCLSFPALAAADTRPLEHVVIVWLKDPGDREAQQQIIAASRTLTAIPGVLALRVGSAVASDRPVVDSSFDVALVISFTDQAALEGYLSHPLHVQLVEETLKPLVERIQVYDFR